MKSLLILLAVAGMTVPLTTGCTVAHDEKTTTHWDGSTSHDETTVKENPVTGSRTVEKESSHN
jgi:hypothetical protein